MSDFRMEQSPVNRLTTVTASFGDEREIEAIQEVIREKIVNALVNKFVEEHGDEILASIDLETIKKKTNDKVTVSALKELIK